MGQTTIAVVWGVVFTPEVEEGIAESPVMYNGSDLPIDDIVSVCADVGYVVETGESLGCIGFAIASGCGADDEGYLNGVYSTQDIPTEFPDHYESAVDGWAFLQCWLKANRNGYQLPAPQLLLVVVERA